MRQSSDHYGTLHSKMEIAQICWKSRGQPSKRLFGCEWKRLTVVWQMYVDISQDGQSFLPWRWNCVPSKSLKICSILRSTSKALEQLSSLFTENICRYFRKNSNYLHIETIHRTKIPLWEGDEDVFPNSVS